MAEENPYQRETDLNTRKDWLADQKPVDVDIDGMVDYGKNMVTIRDNLQSHGGQLNLLNEMPAAAWEGAVLPEAKYMRSQMLQNSGELQQYITYLGTALTNTGMAAQTIADAYSSTDGWSAASLDAVRFAFGDTDAPRPPGLPPFITGKTYWDQYFENLSGAGQDGAENEGTGEKKFTDTGQPVVNPDGSITHTSVAPDGSVQLMTTQMLPGGGTLVTYVTKDPSGKVISTTSSKTTTVVRDNSTITTTTDYDAHGKPTGGHRQTDSYGADGSRSQTDEKLGADGKPTSKTVDQHNADGTRHVTETDGKGKVTQELHTGQDTEGVSTSDALDSPSKSALEEIKQHDYGI
ncbi:hypothetical protein [Micromonospora avicenniae]|uniref:YD repeat-containing protein n=1 Tax=Micromonospora avicenniae TaxID=1198245 RepID=A0A1N7CMV1_9ACTN|nr:hypothetical protein [Micromonospora avicenniae]SIR64936.1 YD repeat-containing protein [Micromonospora avicenniae]